MKQNKRRVVLAALTIGLVLTILPGAIALADCKITSTASGGADTVYCSDPDDTNGIATSWGNDTITIAADTEVRSTGLTIDTGSGNDVVTNRGRVTSSGGDAINLRTGVDKLDNYGYVQGSDDGVWCTPQSGQTCTFNNYSGANLLASNEVVDTSNTGGTVVVNNWGTIRSTYQEGMHFFSNSSASRHTVNNRGTVQGRSHAIEVNDAPVSVTNSGTLYSTRQNGVRGEDYADSVTNSGRVRSDYDPAVHLGGASDTLNNTGTIEAKNDSSTYAAVQMGDGNDTVTTSGNIRELGIGYAAVSLMEGNDRITVKGGEIRGWIHAGNGYDILIFQFNGTTSEVETFRNRVMTQSPSGGSATWRTWTYEWRSFEEIRMILNGTTYYNKLSTATASTDTASAQSTETQTMGAASLDAVVMALDGGDGMASDPTDTVEDESQPIEELPEEEPTAEVTEEPTPVATEQPTEEPTQAPTQEPTPEPTAVVTEEPAPVPTTEPATQPEPPVLAAGYYEENAVGIVYTGNWSYHAKHGASGDGFMRTNDQTASVTFRFEGTRLTLFRTLHKNRGAMEVCIDGVCQTVENRTNGLTLAAPVVFDVPAGIHQVVIRNLSGQYIDLDAVQVEVIVEAAATEEPAATAEPTQEGDASGSATDN